MKNIVALVSGRGSNLQAIVRAARDEGWPARVAAVVGNRPDAGGLEFAREQGIAAVALDHRAYPDRAAFDADLARAIEAHAADVIVLAGFMRILTPGFVRRFDGRLVNIHPSLLPAFAGLHTHRRAIESGCKLAGATVHFVDAEVDHGPIIAQAAVPVLASDDETRLAARVLAAEHVLYPRALGWIVRDELTLQGGRVVHRDGAPQWLVSPHELSAHRDAW
jgi:phosphoribosylglycinamide formyltransferase-1